MLEKAWQICLAHQLRDCQYAVEAGNRIFAPAMMALLLRACVLARRRGRLKDSTLTRNLPGAQVFEWQLLATSRCARSPTATVSLGCIADD